MAVPAPAWFNDLFAHRHWVQRIRPVPNVYTHTVFVPEFRKMLGEDLARVTAQRRLPADALTRIPVAELRDGPLALFSTPEWAALLQGLAGGAGSELSGILEFRPPGCPADALEPLTERAVTATYVLTEEPVAAAPAWVLATGRGDEDGAADLEIAELDNSMLLVPAAPGLRSGAAATGDTGRITVTTWLTGASR